ncbi:Breast carcinoma amplified sequence 3 [Chamberlinius hualienensis]
MCDSLSLGQYYSASFVSLKTGDVHTIKFKNPICNIYCNKKVIAVTFPERIAIVDACTLKLRSTISSCYPSTGPNLNPIALGPHWLAYSDQKRVSLHLSGGGVAGYGIQSYTATVIHAAKSITKGLAMFGETVASSLTGGCKQSHSLTKKETFSGDSGQNHAGVVTIVDVINIGEGEVNVNDESIGEGVVAHFVAHVNGPVAAMQFDPSGVLLITADREGHNFHVFRILPHPSCSSLGAVHHLYTLYRGDTTAKVQDITVSLDSRWVAISTLRGTTHIFPVSSYGGTPNVRTHASTRVVNKASRFYKSAGLEDIQQPPTGRSSPILTGSPSSSGLAHSAGSAIRTYDSHPSISYNRAVSSRMGNIRLSPYPHPTVVQPLAQIRQSSFAGFAYSGGARSPPTRGATTHSSSLDNFSVAAVFAPPRSWLVGSPGLTKDKEKRPVDSLFVVDCSGTVTEYYLEPKSSSSTVKAGHEAPIDLEVQPHVQWHLNRLSISSEVKPPLSSTNPLIIAQESLHSHNDPPDGSGRSKLSSSPCNNVDSESDIKTQDEDWLSQVEIITYAGPNRRLWMGPQFSFRPFQHPANTTILSATSSALLGQGPDTSFVSGGFEGPNSLVDDVGPESFIQRSSARSTPMAMPGGARQGGALLIEAGSFEQSPGILDMYSYSSWQDSLTVATGAVGGIIPQCSGVGGFVYERPHDDQLRESLADAMLESPPRASGQSSRNTNTNDGSAETLGGRSIVACHYGSELGGNSETQLTWDTNTGSSEELSTSSSQSCSASQMSDAPLHSNDHLIGFPPATTPTSSSPDVSLMGRSDSRS